jgi:hypothetical protein
MRRDYLELIRHLAHKRFIQEKLGTDTDFEKLWGDALIIDGTSDTEDPS